MRQGIGLVALVVREYDEAIDFYVGRLGFTLVEDTCIPEQDRSQRPVHRLGHQRPGDRSMSLLISRLSATAVFPGELA